MLTPSEVKTMRLLCAGKIYKEIATETGVSVNTVKKHLKNAYRKLSVPNRANACIVFKQKY